MDNEKLARPLKAANYQGFLAVQIDFLHPDYNWGEEAADAQSAKKLKRIARVAG